MGRISRRVTFQVLLALAAEAVLDPAEARAGRAVADDCDSGDNDNCQASTTKKGAK